jgi:23S rRNA pseudouridine1911/1915/1917 synthase
LARPPSRLRLVAEADEPLLRLVARRSGVAEDLAKEAIARGGAFVQGKRERNPQAGVAAQEDLEGGASLPELCTELLAALGEKQTQALLVHRLDRGTTGITVLARTRRAQAALLEEFRERRVDKEYRALVGGRLREDERTVDSAIEGRPARTRFRVLERWPLGMSIAAFPETGRTHQVRLHLEALGCPLLGDKAHGGPMFLTRADGARLDVARPLLHALALRVRHPDDGELQVAAPLPPDFEAALRWLRG